MCLTELLCICDCYSVSRNNIKGSGEALGEALKTNTSLRTLKMRWCGLDANDGKGLAGGLAVHSGLTKLDLRYNHFSDEAKDMIRKAVEDREGFVLKL